MAPRETENYAYSKFWGEKQRALWYVMVFSGVVIRHSATLLFTRSNAIKRHPDYFNVFFVFTVMQ